MKTRRTESIILCLAVVWISQSSVGRSHAEDTQSTTRNGARRVAGCGRDSAFHVCQSLGINVELEEIDRALSHEPVVSVADLREVLEARGLFCRSLWLKPDNVDLVVAALHEPGRRRSAIVALPSKDAIVRHFVVLLDANRSQLIIWDAGESQSFGMPFDKTLSVGCPLLLIGTDDSFATVIDARRRSVSRLVRSAISSRFMTAGVVAILSFWTWRALSPRNSDKLNALGARTRVRLRHLADLASRPRTLVTISGLTAIVIGIHHLLWIESNPLIAETSVLELGPKPIGSSHSASFRVRNRSLWRTCEIVSVRTTCSCLTPDVDGPVIQPGGSAIVRTKVMVQYGGKAEQAVLVTPSEALPGFTVKIRYHGFESTRLTPEQFNIGGFPQGVAETKNVSIKVVNFKGQPAPIRVGDENVMSEGMSASVVGSGKVAQDGEFMLQIQCSGKRALGTFTERITLSTIEDTPRSFLVIAHGHIVSPITIEPNTLFLPTGSDVQPARETVSIHSRVGDLEFAEIDSNCDSLSVRLLPDSSDNGIRRILVQHTGKNAAIREACIRISTRHPLQREFEIPVYITPRHER